MHPQPEQESIFMTVFAGRVRFGDIFRRSLRATTKKGRQLFFGKKVHPRRQNPGYACDLIFSIGVARGCTRTLMAEKIWGPDLQGKVVSALPGRECTPRQSKSSFFRKLGKLGRSGRWEWLI